MFKTMAGAIAMVICGSVVIAFGVSQFLILLERTDYRLIDKKYQMELTEEKFQFGTSDGFAIATAFWSAAGPLVPEIGQLKFIIKSWGGAEEAVQFTDLRQRPCTDDDFNKRDDPSEDSIYGFHSLSKAT